MPENSYLKFCKLRKTRPFRVSSYSLLSFAYEDFNLIARIISHIKYVWNPIDLRQML